MRPGAGEGVLGGMRGELPPPPCTPPLPPLLLPPPPPMPALLSRTAACVILSGSLQGCA